MRTITHSEFVNAAGDGVYVSTVHYANPAERVAGDAAVQRVVVAQAVVPFGDKGEPFDPPEYPMGSANVPADYTPVNDGSRWVWRHVSTLDQREEPWPSDKDAAWVDAQTGQEPTQAGQALAHAMHTAAEGGEGCDSVACSITQGGFRLMAGEWVVTLLFLVLAVVVLTVIDHHEGSD